MKLRLLATTLLCALLFASCQKKNAVTETIPADSFMVVKLDANKLIADLEIKVEGNKLVTPDYLPAIPEEKQEQVIELFKAIDAENIFCVVPDMNGAGLSVLTCELKNKEAIEAFAKEEFGDYTTSGSFTVYDDVLFVRDNQVWLVYADTGKGQAALEDMLKRAEKKSLYDLDEVAKRLSEANLMNVMMSQPYAADENHGGAPKVVVCVNTKGNTLEGSSVNIYPDGTPFVVEGVTDIATEALAYLPGNPLMEFACGLSDKIDWPTLLSAATSQLPLTQQAQLGMATEYLKQLDGTIAGGVALADGATVATAAQNPMQGLKFCLLAHMKQQGLQQIDAAIRQFAPQLGASFKDEGNGMYSYTEGGMTFYGGAVDGYFYVGNIKPSNTTNTTDNTAIFNGQQSAMVLDIPNLSAVAPKCNFGIKGEAKGSGDKGTFTFTLTDTKAPFLATLIRAFIL